MSITSTLFGLKRHFGNDDDRGREKRLLLAERSGWRIWLSIKRPDQLVGRLSSIFFGQAECFPRPFFQTQNDNTLK